MKDHGRPQAGSTGPGLWSSVVAAPSGEATATPPARPAADQAPRPALSAHRCHVGASSASLRQLARRHPLTVDIAIALAFYGLTLLTAVTGPTGLGAGRSAALAVTLAGIAYGCLLFRHRWPFPVLAVAIGAAEGYMALRRGEIWILPSPLIALYTVADRMGRRRRSLLAGWLAVGLLAAAHALFKSSWLGPENLTLTALGALALAAGDASRSRRRYVAEIEERARRAEQNHEQEAQRRVTEERLRIARDLHDILGHRIALINVQAGVASHVFDNQPEQAKHALTLIRQAGGSALEELRDTLGLLRQPGEPDTPTEPTVGLSGLPSLVALFTRMGLCIEQRCVGTVRPLHGAADLTAYRVIQESLTNAHKHADGTTVRIVLGYEPDRLCVVVEDDGPPDGVRRHAPHIPALSAIGAGHGIVGMRERVAAVGGELRAGSRDEGGFRVMATLPLPVDGPA